MSNCDKLSTLAACINSTRHYPEDASTTPANPTFWDNWSVEGKTLYYYRHDDMLNMTMRWQGGICHCWAIDMIAGIALDDLGLPWLYSKQKDEIASGEGVWTAFGEYSSAGMPGNLESLIYKDANENRRYIDA